MVVEPSNPGRQPGKTESGQMARMTHEFTHGLERETVRQLVKHAWNHYERSYPKYHPQCTWKGPDLVEVKFRAGFVKLAGDLEITDDKIRLGLQVPATLRFLKGRALTVVEAEIKKWLAKADEISSGESG